MGTNCKNVVERVMDYLDGEMSEGLTAELREHLSACPPCIEFLDSYRRTPELCRKALVADMPRELADRLTAFLRAKIPRR